MSITSSQFNSIRKKYDKKHRDAIMLRDENERIVNEKVDGYKELSSAIASLSVESARRAISGDKSALDDLRTTIADLSKQKKALMISAGFPADFLEPKFECSDCKDTGYIDNNMCHCFKQQIINILYNQSNIIDSLDKVGFDGLSERYYSGDDLSNFLDAKEKSLKFVENFDNDYQNLLFYGTVGVGKSMLSQCIAKDLLNTGHSVIYFSAVTLFDTLYNKKDDKGDIENIYNCDLLIIDDLGTEFPNNFVVSSLFSLLNERALRRKPVIISTNLTLIELKDRYTDRAFSRVTGGYTLCKMSGPDIRIANRVNSN